MDKKQSQIRISAFPLYSILLLYSIAAISFVATIYFGKEWEAHAVSIGFVVGTIIIPVVAVAASFAVQVVTLYTENKTRERYIRQESETRRLKDISFSKFLTALETVNTKGNFGMVFLGYFIEEWSQTMNKLSTGVYTIHKDYWKVCAKLNGFGKLGVDCTSIVPIEAWDEKSPSKDAELIEYKRDQKIQLIDQGICVSRTFLIYRRQAEENQYFTRFKDVCFNQAKEGFLIYYIILDDIINAEEKSLVSKDISLINGTLLMIGRLSADNHNVYYYDFYDLSVFRRGNEASISLEAFEPAFALIENCADVMKGNPAELKINSIRKPIDEFPYFDEAMKTAIKSVINQ